MTICKNCEHVSIENQGHSTLDYFCQANGRLTTTDPVTGEKTYFGVNDLGKSYFTPEKYFLCRDINTQGECPQYAERKNWRMWL
jgi:hypothetical protein